jgi:hypothetical protein
MSRAWQSRLGITFKQSHGGTLGEVSAKQSPKGRRTDIDPERRSAACRRPHPLGVESQACTSLRCGCPCHPRP